jgi:hypothetical protein
MALQFQISQTPFRFGLAENTDPHAVPLGTLTTADNVVWKKSGRLEKRFGYSALTASILSGGSLSKCVRLVTRDKELSLFDGNNLYSYSAPQTKWNAVDRLPPLRATWEPLVDSSTTAGDCDVAVWGDVLVYAYVAATGAAGAIWVQARERSTGVTVAKPLLVAASGGTPRVLIRGTTALILYTTSATLYVRELNLLTGAFVAASHVLYSDLYSSGPMYDAMMVGTDLLIGYARYRAHIFLVDSWKNYSDIRVIRTSSTYVEQAANTLESVYVGEPWVPVVRCLCIHATAGESMYVAYSRTNNSGTPEVQSMIGVVDASTMAITGSPTQVLGRTSARVGVVRYNATSCVYIGSDTTPGTSAYYERIESFLVSNASAKVANTTRVTVHSAIVSKPFTIGGRFYIVTSTNCRYTESDTQVIPQPTHTLIEIDTVASSTSNNTSHWHIGTLNPRTAAHNTVETDTWGNQYTSFITSVAAAADGSMVVAVPRATDPQIHYEKVARACDVATFSVVSTSDDQARVVQVGQLSALAGATGGFFDGEIMNPFGFLHEPFVQTSVAIAGSGTLTNGTYLYSFVYEWRDAVGILHRSAATVPISFFIDTNNLGVTHTVLYDAASPKQNVSSGFYTSGASPALVVPYRSIKAGTVLYRMPASVLWANDPLSHSHSWADTNADTVLAGRPVLYTTGGILDDDVPPALSTIVMHRSRIWGIDGGGKTIWFTKSTQDDFGVAPAFNSTLRVLSDRSMTALASMDDKLVVFGADWISYVLGDGPGPNGQGSDLTPLNPVQTDSGCANPRSVVSMPDGIMFQTSRGICLLTRGLEVVWIGRPIKDRLAAYPCITSAVLVAKYNQVRFTCNDLASSPTAGIVLVFDYVEKQWSTFSLRDADVYPSPVADAVVCNGVYTWATPGGAVYQETESTYLDNGTWVPLTIETAWMSAAGPLAFQSVRSLVFEGTSGSNHDLTVELGFDGSTDYQQSHTFVAGSDVTRTGFLSGAITVGTRRKCQHLRVRWTDATPSIPTMWPVGTGQGPSLDTMGLEVGVKIGTASVAAKRG